MSEIQDRISEKIKDISKCTEELYEYIPGSYEEYYKNPLKKLACERLYEKIIEATISIALFILRYKEWETPRDEGGAFQVLADKGVISEILATRLRDAKGMRNFIIHQYGEIDDLKVYTAITEELAEDINKFIEAIENFLSTK